MVEKHVYSEEFLVFIANLIDDVKLPIDYVKIEKEKKFIPCPY